MNFNPRKIDKSLLIQSVIGGLIIGFSVVLYITTLIHGERRGFYILLLLFYIYTYMDSSMDRNYYATIFKTFPILEQDYIQFLLLRNRMKYFITSIISVAIVVCFSVVFKESITLLMSGFIMICVVHYISTRRHILKSYSTNRFMILDDLFAYAFLAQIMIYPLFWNYLSYGKLSVSLLIFTIIMYLCFIIYNVESIKSTLKRNNKGAKYEPNH